ncbi:CRISPR-associated Cas4 family protein [Myxococcus stipitatus DSM 14675]|uniref:CRISPR-associated exonuclease Cas4 n=1 Tax=Myxococcus stipitatus (strain DSM 14675 / JCM 12634 / Mx s8) TaxID=1278073 RepID=L7ULU4_MYXSD|nr:CRISPR-associated protein Cas4 [Myxococcus stipitatus]AGC48885.1 CRISPR-associated Cas4 family protein [Myxococcus stipitatus DSM 14675]
MEPRETWVALSALQHLLFCERQAALIHVERLWVEDVNTAQGRLLHERVDLPGHDARPGRRVERAVRLGCQRLRLTGRADLVEYHPDGTSPTGWRPFPVEVKRARRKSEEADRVQLCAQALCLEEMHGVDVPEGALFHGAEHRRQAVRFDARLRTLTEDAVARMHELLARCQVPAVPRAPKCEKCSLESMCLPQVTAGQRRASDHLRRMVEPVEF